MIFQGFCRREARPEREELPALVVGGLQDRGNVLLCQEAVDAVHLQAAEAKKSN